MRTRRPLQTYAMIGAAAASMVVLPLTMAAAQDGAEQVSQDAEDSADDSIESAESAASVDEEVSADGEAEILALVEVEGEGEEKAEKVTLCHKPDGANPHSIEVSADALADHTEHGDTEGACEGELTKQERKEARDQAKAERAEDRDAAKAERKAAKAATNA